jgi:hypothetical protein
LSGKRKFDAISNVSSLLPGGKQATKLPIPTEFPKYPFPTHTSTSESNPKKSDKDSKESKNDSKSDSKPQVIAQQVISILMTEDPQTISSLVSAISNATKDIVLQTVETLQILGVVVQVEFADGSDLKHPMYTLVNFARASKAINLQDIVEAIEQKKASTDNTKRRIEELKELATMEMTPAARSLRLKDLLDEFTANDPSLREDPLYRNLQEQLQREKLTTLSSTSRHR